MGLSSRRRGPGRAVLISASLLFTVCAFCADAFARENPPRYKKPGLWPTVKIALAWTGMIGGGVIAFGCLAGALLSMLRGRANPFGRKTDKVFKQTQVCLNGHIIRGGLPWQK